MPDVEVYWAARDLAGSPFGNHHFIIFYLPQGFSLLRTRVHQVRGASLGCVTVSGFNANGNLEVGFNDIDDVREVQNYNLGRRSTLEQHKVTPASGGGWGFAQRLEEYSYNYQRNQRLTPIEYSITSANCATWVNTIFKAANISRSERLSLGEFSGVDWGEEDEFQVDMFYTYPSIAASGYE